MVEAHRELGWNVSFIWIMYALLGATAVVFGLGIRRRYRQWQIGRPVDRTSAPGARLMAMLKEILLQRGVGRERLPALFHGLIFYAFAVMFLTTLLVMLDMDLGTSLFRGTLYLVFSLAADIAGLLALVGIGIALYRRTIARPATLPTRAADHLVLALLAGILLSGFLVEGLRIRVAGDPWAAWSPVGSAFSLLFSGLGADAGRALHAFVWWTHCVMALGFIALIPYTKLLHMVLIPANVALQKTEAWGSLARPDVAALMAAEDIDEAALQIGIATAADFTWRERLGFDGCVECGRCDDVCPSRQARQPLSPRALISELKAFVRSEAGRGNGNGAGAPRQVVGGAIDGDLIWYCRTCGACQEVCPARVEHLDTVVDLRRHQTMMGGSVPVDAARMLKMLGQLGNPFGPQGERMAWIEKMGIPVIGEGESIDVLLWIGCCTTFDPTKQQIAQDLCRLLQATGIRFGVLGADERCCGDPARLLGDESLFQEVARSQIELLNRRRFQVLLTACPHCFNVLAHEYPQFGGNYRVVHHTEYLHEMLWSDHLRPVGLPAQKAVYHDPCYLGRFQKIYDSPREVLRAIPGVNVAEMKNARSRSLCCGGGGGHFWMDLKAGERINNLRVDQAQAQGADTIVTSCAYCKQMLEDSVKLRDLDERIRVVDIATLTLESLRLPQDSFARRQ